MWSLADVHKMTVNALFDAFFTPTSVFNTAATRWRACCVWGVWGVGGGGGEMININSRAD